MVSTAGGAGQSAGVDKIAGDARRAEVGVDDRGKGAAEAGSAALGA